MVQTVEALKWIARGGGGHSITGCFKERIQQRCVWDLLHLADVALGQEDGPDGPFTTFPAVGFCESFHLSSVRGYLNGSGYVNA